MTDGNGEQEIVELVALVDEIQRRLNGFSSNAVMSVGPVMADVIELREEVLERGKNYGMVNKNATVSEYRSRAHDVHVTVQDEIER